MRRITHLLFGLAILSALCPCAALAQTQTGTVEGKVTDPQSAVLPGVTLTLTGPRGAQTTVTDETGNFRFVGLQPDTYQLKAELTGFLSQQVDAVLVGLAKTVTLELSLKLGGLTETVDVRGAASTVDVKSAATDTNISNDLLTLMPIYSSTSATLMNAAPAINDRSAYGAQQSYGNALLLDGVDTRDPEGGSAWTFFNQNIIQEVQIGGLGAPAEFGGFSGAVVNTVTKSGGNSYAGLFSIRYTGDSLAGDNISKSVLDANPTLGLAAVTKKLTDYTVQLGGPLKRDKVFFFGSVQRYSTETDPTGPVATSTEISPRFNTKFTFQPTPNDTIIAGMQYDNYNLTGRVGNWPAAQTTDRQTVEEDAPEWVWNFQWRKIFGSSAFLEAKFTGYDGYYNLDPVDPAPYTFDGLTGEYCCGGGGGLLYNDRSRNQVQIAVTKYAEKYGRHSFKFGLEIERSHGRNIGEPYGPSNAYTFAYGGVPYYQYNYSYDVQGDNKRTSAFAQDQWTSGKLTLNLGIRLDRIRGRSPILNKDVYTPGNAWGPRIGVAYDLTGKGLTAVKAYYGRYFEGAAFGFFESGVPGIGDLTKYPILPNGQLGPPDVVVPGIVYGIDPDIKHPRTDEFNVSYETQVTGSVRFTATGIWRNTSDFINNIINNARWRPVTLNNALTGQPFTGYFWANSGSSNDSFLIRNTEGFDYLSTDGTAVATADPKRSYKGLMLQLNSSLKKHFGYQLSYVLAKASGSVDNTGFGNWLGGTSWDSPNTAVINADGELTNSRRHEIKAYVSYEVPRINVMLGGAYTGESGRTFTPYGQYSSAQLNLPLSSRRQIFLAPRGSERNDFFNQFDLRAEKALLLSGHRFGVFVDIANVFNTASVIQRQNRFPSTTISGETVAYRAPTSLQPARQVTIGGRWMF